MQCVVSLVALCRSCCDVCSGPVLQVAAANGEVIITNDGATILNKMTVAHPAAKMLVELAKSQVSHAWVEPGPLAAAAVAAIVIVAAAGGALVMQGAMCACAASQGWRRPPCMLCNS